MADCRQCADFNWCAEHEDCGLFNPKPTITNADRIRAMTDEELAFELAQSGCPKIYFNKDNEVVDCPAEKEPSRGDCVKCWLCWLKQEVEA